MAADMAADMVDTTEVIITITAIIITGIIITIMGTTTDTIMVDSVISVKLDDSGRSIVDYLLIV